MNPLLKNTKLRNLEEQNFNVEYSEEQQFLRQYFDANSCS